MLAKRGEPTLLKIILIVIFILYDIDEYMFSLLRFMYQVFKLSVLNSLFIISKYKKALR